MYPCPRCHRSPTPRAPPQPPTTTHLQAQLDVLRERIEITNDRSLTCSRGELLELRRSLEERASHIERSLQLGGVGCRVEGEVRRLASEGESARARARSRPHGRLVGSRGGVSTSIFPRTSTKSEPTNKTLADGSPVPSTRLSSVLAL